MLRYIVLVAPLISIALFGSITPASAQNNGLQIQLNPDILPAPTIINPRLQVIPTPEVNFGLLDLYDNGDVIPVNQLDNPPLIYSTEILSARVVPSIIFSPETDGILRIIILGAIPDKIFEYDPDKLELNTYFRNY